MQAIDWLAGHHVRVVNISLSLPEKAADYTRLCATIAEHEDMFFSIAAGNSGQEAVVYPAACSATNKIVVGAATADGKVPAYSGRADLVGRLPPAPVSVSEYWRGEGERRFRSNDLAGARQAFEKGLNANPIPQTFALLAHDLGAVAYNQAQFDDAAGWFERAIKAVPTSSQSYVELSNILTRRERFEAARALLEAGISAGADSPELRDRLARVYLDLDRPKDARAQIAEIERQKPNLDGLADLRRAAQNMVIVEDAIAAGSTPAEFLGIFVKSGEGNLVRFVVKRWNPNLNEVPPGAAVVPLSTAASLGHLAIVNFLLESGASVDGRDRTYGLTALMTAAAAGREEICRELVRRGASLEFQDSLGFTPLMFAAEGGYTELVRFFLEHGAAVSTKSKEGFTALDYATKYGHSGIAEMITKAANCYTVKCTP